jgi:hypothetical protein
MLAGELSDERSTQMARTSPVAAGTPSEESAGALGINVTAHTTAAISL